jgi:ribosomal protein L11 methyltransferase
MSSSYVEVQISADEELVEQLVAILPQLGFEGFWEDGPMLRCYIGSARWSPEMREEVQSVINRMTPSNSSASPQVAVNTIENKNWNEEWEKTIKPIQVTDRIVIKPTWHKYVTTPGQIVITIDPKMSFGTGYHETTRLVLRLMEKHVDAGMSVLDVGTGTGVLAIAGVSLGATSAVGVDVDEWSFDNAVENVMLNHVQDQVRIIHGELSSVPEGKFDMIVANIQLNVIVPLLSEMKERLSAAGVMILSGLLLPDREQIVSALASLGLKVCEEIKENEWIALAVSDITFSLER